MDAIELAFAGIARQAELIAAGEVSSRELVELYIERIERFNPDLGAFRVLLAERALTEADEADASRGAKQPARGRRGRSAASSPAGELDDHPLLGVPIAIKDNVDVAGELTAMGTRGQDQAAAADGEIVRRLRAAGAIVIGKTNTPELCAVPWTESATRGLTRNPWNVEHTPGGSSGGSACAVAAGLIGAAVGSDGGGSIRYPAAYCGLFGLKGQRGRVPLAPYVDASQGLSVNGVLTRSVRDTALFYDAVSEGSPDPGAPALPPSSFLAELAEPVNAMRIGVSTKLPPSPLTRLQADNEAAVLETAELLRGLGHEVSECELDHGALAPAPEFTARFIAGIHDDAEGLPHPERLERRMRAIARIGGLMEPGAVGWARSREAQYAQRMNRPFADFDVLLTPVTPAPAPKLGACEGRGWVWTFVVAASTVPYAAPWNVTGQPAASVPAGFGWGGLPRAVQLVAPANEETRLLRLAAQIEGVRPWGQSRPPGFA
jgi:amidase